MGPCDDYRVPNIAVTLDLCCDAFAMFTSSKQNGRHGWGFVDWKHGQFHSLIDDTVEADGLPWPWDFQQGRKY